MRVRKHLPVQIRATKPAQLMLDPLRVPKPMQVDPTSGQWVNDAKQRQCPECMNFFVPATLTNGKPSTRKVCSTACEHRQKRRNVRAKRIEAVKQAIEGQVRVVEAAATVLAGLRDHLRDLERTHS